MYADLTEAQFQRVIEELLLTYGWRVFYVIASTREIERKTGRKRGERFRVRNVNTNGVGFPDMFAIRGSRGPRGMLMAQGPRQLFIENKRDLGPRGGGNTPGAHRVELSPEQIEWGDLIQEFAGEANTGERVRVDYVILRPSGYDDFERMVR